MTFKTIIKIFLPLLIIAIALFSFNSLKASKAERKKPKAKEKIWLVESIDASLEDLSANLTLYSTIESPALQTISSPADAIVKQVHIKSGQSVKQGDLLITLDKQDFIHTLNKAKADVLDIDAQIAQLELKQQSNEKALTLEKNLLKLSQDELNRVSRLKQSGLGSDSVLTDAQSNLAKQELSVINRSNEVLQFEPKLQQLKAKKSRLESSLSQAQLDYQRSSIKADFDGTLVSLDIAQGDRVKSSQKLLSLYPNNQLEAKTRIPAKYQPEIQAMLATGQRIKATASIANQTVNLVLERFAGQATANGIEVYFKILDGQQYLRLGNFLKLTINRETQQQVVKLPLQALYGTSRIYLIEEKRLKALNVETVGYYHDENQQKFVLIKHPELNSEDKIAVTHLPNAVSGLKVKTREK